MKDRIGMKRVEQFDPDRGCFACGPDNPHGLRMTFYTDGTQYYSWPTIPGHLVGWERIAHGGVITTILDEIMSWTAIHYFQMLILTRSIKVDFLHPVYVEQPLEASGRVDRRDSDRTATLSALLRNGAGKVCARAQGDFALLTPKAARRMSVMAPELIDLFEEYLAQLRK